MATDGAKLAIKEHWAILLDECNEAEIFCEKQT
jgi:hypothetical protein